MCLFVSIVNIPMYLCCFYVLIFHKIILTPFQVKSPLRVWQKRALIYPENGRPYDYKPIQIVDFQRFLIFTLMKGIKCLKP